MAARATGWRSGHGAQPQPPRRGSPSPSAAGCAIPSTILPCRAHGARLWPRPRPDIPPSITSKSRSSSSRSSFSDRSCGTGCRAGGAHRERTAWGWPISPHDTFARKESDMTEPFFGNFDLASLSLWLFYGFFALLIFYIQRENMREGYPLEDDDGNVSANQGLFPVPDDKTFRLPHGRGDVTVPSGPAGDPMVDGVGPASWAPRRDMLELDGKGHPKIVPMAATEHFHVAAGRDPRGLPVMGGDGEVVGAITDMWIDEPEQMVRYLEIDLDADHGGGKRLVPLPMARIKSNHVKIRSIFGKHFAGVPQHASPNQVTMLEEDKISGYYAGGTLYASEERLEPQLG